MRLLHKVVKSSDFVSYDGVVSIDNTVIIKPKQVQKRVETGTNSDDVEQLNKTQQEMSLQIENEVKLREAYLNQEYRKKEQKLRDESEAEKQKIISRAIDEGERIKYRARQEGFEQGRQDALNEMQNQLKACRGLLAEINARKDSIYISQENELIDLLYDMVKKVTNHELLTDREIIFSTIKHACKSFRNSDYVKISVAKCDVSETVITDRQMIKKIAGNIPDVEIELLPDAETGTIILDNDKEIIDASIPTQLDFLKEILNAGKKPTDI